jgi:hypothetical protein
MDSQRQGGIVSSPPGAHVSTRQPASVQLTTPREEEGLRWDGKDTGRAEWGMKRRSLEAPAAATELIRRMQRPSGQRAKEAKSQNWEKGE